MRRSAVINDTYTCYEDTMCFFSDKILRTDDVEFAEEFIESAVGEEYVIEFE